MRAQREEHEVLLALSETIQVWRWGCLDDVQLLGEPSTVCIKRQIVDIVSKGILNLTADGCETDDDIRRD